MNPSDNVHINCWKIVSMTNHRDDSEFPYKIVLKSWAKEDGQQEVRQKTQPLFAYQYTKTLAAARYYIINRALNNPNNFHYDIYKLNESGQYQAVEKGNRWTIKDWILPTNKEFHSQMVNHLEAIPPTHRMFWPTRKLNSVDVKEFIANELNGVLCSHLEVLWGYGRYATRFDNVRYPIGLQALVADYLEKHYQGPEPDWRLKEYPAKERYLNFYRMWAKALPVLRAANAHDVIREMEKLSASLLMEVGSLANADLWDEKIRIWNEVNLREGETSDMF